MRRHRAGEIVSKLRRVEELAASGKRISECVQEIGVTEVTYYRWRNRYGGFESDLAEYLAGIDQIPRWIAPESVTAAPTEFTTACPRAGPDLYGIL